MWFSFVCMNTFMSVCQVKYVLMYVCAVRLHVHVFARVCPCVCVCVCVRVHVYFFFMFVHMYRVLSFGIVYNMCRMSCEFFERLRGYGYGFGFRLLRYVYCFE